MNMPPHLFPFCPLDKCGNDDKGNDHDAIEGKLFIGHKANPMSLSPICRFLSPPPTELRHHRCSAGVWARLDRNMRNVGSVWPSD